MPINQSKLLFIALLGLSLAACGEKKEEDVADTEDADDPAGTVSGAGGGGAKTDTFSLVGTWSRTNCVATALNLDEEGGGEEFKKESHEFTADGTMNVTMMMFGSAACTAKFIELNVEATYTVGAEVSADPVVKELDFEVIAGTFTVHDAQLVADLNGAGGGMGLLDEEEEGGGFPCEKTTAWVLGEAVSFADLTCDADFPKIGEKLYTLVSRDGDVLKLSKEDGKTVETRPTEVPTEEEEFFVKETVID